MYDEWMSLDCKKKQTSGKSFVQNRVMAGKAEFVNSTDTGSFIFAKGLLTESHVLLFEDGRISKNNSRRRRGFLFLMASLVITVDNFVLFWITNQ